MKKGLLRRNIFIVYALTALTNAWFWIAIWVYFYLRFTDYAGIGLLESVMIATYVFGEVPTGAIADLLGKKKTLTLAYTLQAAGSVLMGLSGSFEMLALSVFILSVGGVLASGTVEALIYDSLLSVKEEDRFEKVLANNATIRMATLGAVSIVGGYMYSLSPGIPFLAQAVTASIAVVITLLLCEPPIDTEHFSLKNYIKQTKEGFQELFKTAEVKKQNMLIIVLTMIAVLNGHVLIDTQLYSLGWNPTELGYIATLMFFLSAVLSQLTPFFAKLFGRWRAIVIAALLISVSMLVVPILGVFIATFFVISRDGILQVFGNNANALINKTTESKYRATTLSTYSMLANIPYVLLAYQLGRFMDIWSVNQVVFVLGVLLLFIGLAAMSIKKR